jgi:uracil-DNA glycosylase
MLESAAPVHPEMIASALAWWQDSGVDTMIDEVASPWILREVKPAAPVPAPEKVEAPLPASLAEFHEWLATSTELDPVAGPASNRIAVSGQADARLMILIDMPEAEDRAAGHLIAGEAGPLFERMLAAIGHDRSTCLIATFCPGRAAGGIIPQMASERLTAIARHHLALARPERLWLMGQAVSRALLGADIRPGLGRLHNFNHEGGIVAAVSSFSPRFLLANPKRKAAAWADMQMLLRGTDA